MKNELVKKYNKTKSLKLIAALLIDLVGISTYFIPLIGESGDVVWGPISGLLILLLFPNRKKMAIGGVIEELLPFIDFVPTASLAWTLDYVKDKEKTFSTFVKNKVNEEQYMKEILNTHGSDSEK